MWTRFVDMHSGGGAKEDWTLIFIEAPEALAKLVFYNKFGHNPERVTCTCCGEDYAVCEECDSLELSTAYDRKSYQSEDLEPLEEFVKHQDVLIIRKEDILPEWCEGDLPAQGYIWHD